MSNWDKEIDDLFRQEDNKKEYFPIDIEQRLWNLERNKLSNGKLYAKNKDFRRSSRFHPNPNFLVHEQVCALIKRGSMCLYKWMRNGEFPKPDYINGRQIWLLKDIQQWIKDNPKKMNRKTKIHSST